MKKLFNRTFFRFVLLFVVILAVSFFVMFLTSIYEAKLEEKTSDAPININNL